MSPDRDALISEIKALAPWHHSLELFDGMTTGKVFSETETLLPQENEGVSLISPKPRFISRANQLYPDGMQGKRFLDCACNAGAYCFYARELGADYSVGFDIREHWINQAKFVQRHRTVSPTDRIEFRVMDLYELSAQGFDKFDFVYFSGIFYHLPDPVTGLKMAADLTSDVIVLNTAMMAGNLETDGLTMAKESVERVMSGVYELAWFPNNVSTLTNILRWLGFVEMKLTKDKQKNPAGRRRVEIVASRTKDRLGNLAGELLP